MGDTSFDPWLVQNDRCGYCKAVIRHERGCPVPAGETEEYQAPREFSPAQEAQIDALTKSWDEQSAQDAADAAEERREQEQENHPPYKHCPRCDAPSYDLSAGACWNCEKEFE
jgi:hypothetical protein